MEHKKDLENPKFAEIKEELTKYLTPFMAGPVHLFHATTEGFEEDLNEKKKALDLLKGFYDSESSTEKNILLYFKGNLVVSALLKNYEDSLNKLSQYRFVPNSQEWAQRTQFYIDLDKTDAIAKVIADVVKSI